MRLCSRVAMANDLDLGSSCVFDLNIALFLHIFRFKLEKSIMDFLAMLFNGKAHL